MTEPTATQTEQAGGLLTMYGTASRIRAFDDKVQALVAAAQVFFIHYPVRGHELISAAIGKALRPDDYMTATYRGLADELAKGVPLVEMWGERLGRASGTSNGRGGPMHVTDPEHGLMLMTGVVGGGLPIAIGLGLANQFDGDDRVTVCNFGDGATNIGAFHESLNLASVWNLPIVFVCQNNQYGEHTRFADAQRTAHVVDRAAAYAMHGIRVDGTDPVAMLAAAEDAITYARSGQGPVLLECVTFRTLGHVLSDKNEYMDQDELAGHRANDLLAGFRAVLLAQGHTADDLDAIDRQAAADIEDSYERALAAPAAEGATAANEVVAPPAENIEPDPSDVVSSRITFREAIRSGLLQSMQRDDKVFLMGEDVADSAGGGVFLVSQGLSTAVGEDRVRNTPIAEEAIIGAGIGAAIGGYKSVAEIMFMDFIGVCMDQLANHAAKLRFMSGGRTPVNLTVRMGMVGGTPVGAQHSQSLEALLMHTPGLKVVYPSTPYDAKGLLQACIADPDPCVFVECIGLMMQRGEVPDEPYALPLGRAAVRRSGTDVTVIGYGRLMGAVTKAADSLATDGVDVEVIDLRSLAPLDDATILASAAKTRRVVVVHEAVRTCGAGAEIATRIHEALHADLLKPVRRVTSPDSPVPAAPALVNAFYPAEADIVSACKDLMTK